MWCATPERKGRHAAADTSESDHGADHGHGRAVGGGRLRGVRVTAAGRWGVQALAGDAVVIRVVLKTAPGKQGDIARELR
ncbi:hypothetical protein AB0K37_42070, partial [Actinomadura sp. NPDC049753]